MATTREIIQVTSKFEIYKLDITQNSSNWIKFNTSLNTLSDMNSFTNTSNTTAIEPKTKNSPTKLQGLLLSLLIFIMV